MTGAGDAGRRRWIKQALSVGLAGTAGAAGAGEFAAAASDQGGGAPTIPPAGTHDPQDGPPSRAGLVIRGAHLLSMDPLLGEQRDCDVLIRGNRIMAVGAGLVAAGAREMDGRGKIVMPGLVDAHWHMWNALGRGAGPAQDGRAFFQVLRDMAIRSTPETAQLAVRLAAAQARRAGITTLNNWAHNLRSAEFADAEYGAMAACGLRGRFWYGYPQDLAPGEPMDLPALAQWQRSVSQQRESRIDLGVAVRGPERTPELVWRAEFEEAARLALPVSVHVAVSPAMQEKRAIRQLDARGLLRRGVQLVHATHADEDDLARIAAAGATVCLTPITEMRVGYGLPPIAALLRAQVPISLGIDTTVLAGRADPYAVMQTALNVATAAAHDEHALTPDTVLRWATQGGADEMGWGERLGSVTPGKLADLVLIDAHHPDVAPVGYAAASVVQSCTPAAISHVIANGVVHEAAAMQEELRELSAQAEHAWRRLGA